VLPRPRIAVALLLPLVLGGALAAVAGGPPPEVSARLGRALKLLEPGSFVGSYTTTTHSAVSKRDGSDREESVLVQHNTVLPDGRREMELVSARKNGKDVTEEERKRFNAEVKRQEKKKKDGKAEKDGEKEFKLPFEEGNEKNFAFGAPVPEGELLVQAFEAVADHRKDAGMTRGKLAWNPGTLDPAWIEFTFATMPAGVSEFLFRFEFARTGEEVVLRRMVTSGVGGLLWIKRRFSADVEFSDLVRARPSEATPAATPTAPPPS